MIIIADPDEELEGGVSEIPEHQLEQTEETLEGPEVQVLELSQMAARGLDGPQTLKLTGIIRERPMLVMVDSGATHCFISRTVATALGVEVDTSLTSAVRLGDGRTSAITGLCRRLPLQLGGVEFHIDCYVFELGSVDLILGVSWLATLGEVRANWR